MERHCHRNKTWMVLNMTPRDCFVQYEPSKPPVLKYQIFYELEMSWQNLLHRAACLSPLEHFRQDVLTFFYNNYRKLKAFIWNVKFHLFFYQNIKGQATPKKTHFLSNLRNCTHQVSLNVNAEFTQPMLSICMLGLNQVSLSTYSVIFN